MNYTLIVKEPNAKIRAYSNHIQVSIGKSIKIFAFRHLRSVFINQMATISLLSCKKISSKLDLYIIDPKGFVILEIRNTKKWELTTL